MDKSYIFGCELQRYHAQHVHMAQRLDLYRQAGEWLGTQFAEMTKNEPKTPRPQVEFVEYVGEPDIARDSVVFQLRVNLREVELRQVRIMQPEEIHLVNVPKLGQKLRNCWRYLRDKTGARLEVKQ